eukprot:gnl/Dysnectes_brevis/3028_a3741_410.p1 GENE.gnl/Dysnectes_brevis/3028_a3741_410~~gnl/Dysnectes_brevis/3028_a3741_410.p1  ORF type:complete len:1533 (+),score=313.17 gnl/Dysnectes_brevis/3028_a3741_410:95-4600(+)
MDLSFLDSTIEDDTSRDSIVLNYPDRIKELLKQKQSLATSPSVSPQPIIGSLASDPMPISYTHQNAHNIQPHQHYTHVEHPHSPAPAQEVQEPHAPVHSPQDTRVTPQHLDRGQGPVEMPPSPQWAEVNRLHDTIREISRARVAASAPKPLPAASSRIEQAHPSPSDRSRRAATQELQDALRSAQEELREVEQAATSRSASLRKQVAEVTEKLNHEIELRGTAERRVAELRSELTKDRARLQGSEADERRRADAAELQLQATKHRLAEEQDAWRHERAAFTERLSDMSGQLQGMRGESARLGDQSSTARRAAVDAQRQLEELRSRLERSARESDARLERATRASESRIRELQAVQDKYFEQITQLQAENSALGESNAKLLSDHGLKERETSMVMASRDALESDLKSKIREQNRQLDDLKTALEEQESKSAVAAEDHSLSIAGLEARLADAHRDLQGTRTLLSQSSEEWEAERERMEQALSAAASDHAAALRQAQRQADRRSEELTQALERFHVLELSASENEDTFNIKLAEASERVDQQARELAEQRAAYGQITARLDGEIASRRRSEQQLQQLQKQRADEQNVASNAAARAAEELGSSRQSLQQAWAQLEGRDAELADAKQTLSALRQRLADTEYALEQMRSKLSTADRSIKQWQGRLRSLKHESEESAALTASRAASERNRLEQELAGSEAARNAMSDELEVLAEQLASAKLGRENAEANATQSAQDAEHIRSESRHAMAIALREATETAHRHDQQVASLASQMAALRSSNSELELELDGERDRAEAAARRGEEAAAAASEREEQLSGELEAARRDLAVLRASESATLASHRSELNDLAGKLDRASADLSHERERADTLQKSFESLQSEEEASKDQIRSLTNALSCRERELEASAEEIISARAMAEDTIRRSELQLEAVQGELSQAKADCSRLELEIERVQNDSQRHRSDLDTEIVTSRRELARLRQLVSEADEERGEHEERVRVAENGAARAVQQLEAVSASHTQRLNALREEVLLLERANGEAQANAIQASEASDAAEQSLAAARAQLGATRGELLRLESETTSRISELEREAASLRGRTAAAEQVAADKESTATECEAAMMAMTAELDKLRKHGADSDSEHSAEAEALRNRVADLEQRVLEAETADQTSKASESAASRRCQLLESRQAALQVELERAQAEVASISDTNTKERLSAGSLRSQLEARLEESEESRKQSDSQLKQMESLLVESRNQRDHLSSSLSDLEARLDQSLVERAGMSAPQSSRLAAVLSRVREEYSTRLGAARRETDLLLVENAKLHEAVASLRQKPPRAPRHSHTTVSSHSIGGSGSGGGDSTIVNGAHSSQQQQEISRLRRDLDLARSRSAGTTSTPFQRSRLVAVERELDQARSELSQYRELGLGSPSEAHRLRTELRKERKTRRMETAQHRDELRRVQQVVDAENQRLREEISGLRGQLMTASTHAASRDTKRSHDTRHSALRPSSYALEDSKFSVSQLK